MAAHLSIPLHDLLKAREIYCEICMMLLPMFVKLFDAYVRVAFQEELDAEIGLAGCHI